MPTAADYSITIDGQDVSSRFQPVLTSMTIKQGDGGKSDSLDLKLDDEDGQIAFPRVGADIVAQLWSLDDGSGVTFVGKTDEPKSDGSRGGGMGMTITAHSADLQGEGKHKKHKHKDGGSFKDAATEFAPDGTDVKVDDDVGGVTRDYWSMSNESFFSWGQRLADELGATFKIAGSTAVFVSRNSGANAGGTALPVLEATRPGNIINWDMAPVLGRSEYETAKVRYYDAKEAKWKEESVDIKQDGGS